MHQVFPSVCASGNRQRITSQLKLKHTILFFLDKKNNEMQCKLVKIGIKNDFLNPCF